MMEQVCAFAPATIANLNAGFDVFGLALSTIGDRVRLTQNKLNYHRIVHIESEVDLPFDVEKNSCTAVLFAMQKFVGQDVFVDVEIYKGFKAGSGLGSSAASSVAAAVAFNHMLGNPFTKKELLPFCAEGERAACGSPILDNVSAALFGGLVMTHNQNIIQLPFLRDAYVLAYFQQIEIKTEDARNVLPKAYPLKTITKQTSHIAALVHALHSNDLQLFQDALNDEFVEPYRKAFIPNFDLLKKIAVEQNALGFGISGSGPTVFALTQDEETAQNIAQQFEAERNQKEINTLTIIENLNENRAGAIICD